MEVQVQEIEHLRGQIAAAKLEKEEVELERLKIKGEYQKILAEFEDREGKIDALAGKLTAELSISKTYHEELVELRKKTQKLETNYATLHTLHVEVTEARKVAESDKKKYSKELFTTQERLTEMNRDRHRLMDELRAMTERAD